MGNRSFLHFCVPGADELDDLVAEANNHFPTLWKLLLAEGWPEPVRPGHQLLADQGTQLLSSDARAALGRLRALATAMEEHPLRASQPAVVRQFRALQQHVEELLDLADTDDPPPRFSANLEELSWLSQDAPGDFIEGCRADCNRSWAQVEAALQSRDYLTLDAAIGVEDRGGSFQDWKTWAFGFGFAGLSHPYFDTDAEPRAEAYEDYQLPEPETLSPYLFDGFERVQQGHHWGVTWRDPEIESATPRLVLAPTWDEVAPALGQGVWLREGEHWGFALLRENGADLVLQPQLSHWWPAQEDQGLAFATVQREGLIGMLDDKGQWLIEPFAKGLWYLNQGYACFSQGDLYGYVSRAGVITVPAQYEDAVDMDPRGLGLVKQGGLWGAIDGTGRVALPLVYEEVDFSSELSAYVLHQQGRLGLAHLDGSAWVAPAWDEFQPLVPGHLVAVRLDKVWGALDWQGQVRVEPAYRSISWLDENTWLSKDQHPLPPVELFLVVQQGQRRGLVDAWGQVRVPLSYAGLERLFPSIDLLRLRTRPKGLKADRYGVFHLGLGHEVLPCEYRGVHWFEWGEGTGALLSVLDAEELPSGQRLRLLGTEGQPLFASDYAWLGEPGRLDQADFADHMAGGIGRAWKEGGGIKAVRNDGQAFVWLYVDGREGSHAEHMLALAEAGNAHAMLDFARDLRDGVGIDQDQAQARFWTARAAGLEARELVDLDAIPDPPAEPLEGFPIAMADLADLLSQGIGGAVQAETARAWRLHREARVAVLRAGG